MPIQVPPPNVFRPRPYQTPFWKFMENGGKRYIGVWHRRAGKDLNAVAWTAREACLKPGVYWHVGPTYKQARKFVWNGMTVDTYNPSIAHRYRDVFPKEMVARQREDDMMIELKNGSIWQVLGTDDPDSLVGPNPRGIVFSEYSIQNPAAWEYLSPILAENGGWAVFIYTPRGRNHGYRLYRAAQDFMAQQPGRWLAENLTIDVTRKLSPAGELEPVVSEEMIAEERQRGKSEEEIQQEYYGSFNSPLHGSFYGDIMKDIRAEGRITEVRWDPEFPVHTWWDIGYDYTAIIFMQVIGNERRFIDFEGGPDGAFDHWAGIVTRKPYVYGNHIGPWDITKRGAIGGKRLIDEALRLGIRFTKCPKHFKDDAWPQVRMYLKKWECYFDEKKCEHLIDAMHEYHREWDDKAQTFKDTDVHDWASHPADAFRYGVMQEPKTDVHSFRQTVAFSEYNLLEGVHSPERPLHAEDYDPMESWI